MDVKQYVARAFHEIFFNTLYYRVRELRDSDKSLTQSYYEFLNKASTTSMEDEVVKPCLLQIVEKMQADNSMLSKRDAISRIVRFIIPDAVLKNMSTKESDAILKKFVGKLLSATSVEINKTHIKDVVDKRTQKSSDMVYNSIVMLTNSVRNECKDRLTDDHITSSHERNHGKLDTLQYRMEIERLVQENINTEAAMSKMAREILLKEKENRYLRMKLANLERPRPKIRRKIPTPHPSPEPEPEPELSCSILESEPEPIPEVDHSVLDAEGDSDDSFTMSLRD